MRYRSNLLTVIVETPDEKFPDDGLTLVDVQGDTEAEGTRLSDVDWFREEYSNVGDYLLFDDIPVGKGKILIRGHLSAATTSSIDCGEDVDVWWETLEEEQVAT